MRVLHLTGRADRGGGPEHVLQLVGSRIPDLTHYVACPRGVFRGRYASMLGDDRIVDLPHRALRPEALSDLIAQVRRCDIEVLHGHGTAGGVYARLVSALTRIPCVHSFHGVPVTPFWRHQLYRMVEPILARWTARAICVSEGERELVEARWPCYLGRVVVVPNGIGMTPAGHRRAIGAPLRLLSFARIEAQKWPELLPAVVRAAADRGLDPQLTIHGEGMSGDTYRVVTAASAVADRLRWAGPTDDPGAAMSAADVYLSTSRWEGMPLAILEAWRAGLPVVASDVVGNRDLVRDGVTGLLYPLGDAMEAAACLERLVREPGLVERLRANAWQTLIADHSSVQMAARLAGIYRQVVV